MKVIAFIIDYAVVNKILRHLERTRTERSRDPPGESDRPVAGLSSLNRSRNAIAPSGSANTSSPRANRLYTWYKPPSIRIRGALGTQ